MTSYVTPRKNVAYKTYIGLVDQSNTKLLKANPTIASGDFKVSTDGGAFANLATLPSANPASGRSVMIDLSSGEMNGDNVVVQCVDAAGAEWCDLILTIQTSARQIDDLAFPVTTGRGTATDAAGLVDANTVKVGPTGSGIAQTARDLGLSVLLAAGQKVDVDTIKTNPVVNAGTITFPSGATLASTTNITAGTITTVTNLTNAPTAGDFTATMKTSLNAATPSVTVSDKTGFSLVQTFPANFALLGITGAGKLTEVVTYTGNTPQTGDFFATAIAEAAAVPATNASAAAKLAWLAAMGLNPLKQTATTLKLRNNADGADIGTSTTSDDGTTATRGKFA